MAISANTERVAQASASAAALLGALITKPELVPEAFDAGLAVDIFTDPAHRLLVGIFRDCVDRGQVPDVAIMRDRLRDQGGDVVTHAAGFLAETVRSVTVTAHWRDQLAAVKEAAAKRQAAEVADRLARAAANCAPIGPAIEDTFRSLIEISGTTPTRRITPEVLDQLFAENPTLSEPVIEGMAREGETANIVAKSKVGKSWLVYHLLLCMVTGQPFLGLFPCIRGRVLLIDNELSKSLIAHRIFTVAQAMGLRREDYADALEVISLRGQMADLHAIGEMLERVEPGTFRMIALDAWYRALPSGVSENDNGQIAKLYNVIDRIAGRIGCAWVNIHHASKGDQSGKDVTDVGAGAGSQSRAADAHIVLRPHEDEGAVVLDAALRSFPPLEPIVLRWCFPLWKADEDADPGKLRGKMSALDERQASKDEEGKRQLLVVIDEGPATTSKLRQRTGIGAARCERLLGLLVRDGLISVVETEVKGNQCNLYERVK